YFALPCLALVAVLSTRRRTRAVLACLLPIVVLQGGWSVKNWALYGTFSLATSSWGGLHAVTGLNFAGFRADYLRFVIDQTTSENGAPDWATQLARGDLKGLDRLKAETSERDQWVERTVGLSNPVANTLFFGEFFAAGQRGFFQFPRQNPRTMLTKWWIAYHYCWQPISNYGRMLVALFVGENRIRDGLDLPDIVRQLRAGTLPERSFIATGSNFLMKEQKVPPGLTPTRLHTLGFLAPLVLMLNVVGVHVLLPLVALAWVVQRVRGRPPVLDPLRMAVRPAAATVSAYLDGIANFVETAENMRYRLEVEPLIWVVTLICLSELGRLVRAWLRRQSYIPSTNHAPVAGSR